MIITITNKYLIAVAWGPRRVTSKKRYGELSKWDAYPNSVTASLGLWVKWTLNSILKWIRRDFAVVIPTQQASKKKRTLSALNKKEKSNDSVGNKDIDINELLVKREQYRLEKNFKEADRIRDILKSHGVDIKDGKVGN